MLDFSKIDKSEEQWEHVHKHFDNYKSGVKTIKPSQFLNQKAALKIHFIGVWDTVGALGIPNDMELFNLLDNPASWRFHDTTLGEHINIARHAMAMDEKGVAFVLLAGLSMQVIVTLKKNGFRACTLMWAVDTAILTYQI